MINILPIASGLLKLGSKFILDKDKQAEFQFKVIEMTYSFMEKIVTMQTVPWVDAFVKILFALLALARPLGTFYLSLKGVDMAVDAGSVDGLSGGLMAMFPAWGTAREANKRREHRLKELEIAKNSENDITWSAD